MSRVIVSEVKGFRGRVTLCEPLTMPQLFAYEDEQDKSFEAEPSALLTKINELQGVKDESGNVVAEHPTQQDGLEGLPKMRASLLPVRLRQQILPVDDQVEGEFAQRPRLLQRPRSGQDHRRRGGTGVLAVEAAGVVHTDLQRGFIRAEVIPCADLVAAGGLPEARKRGLLRLEGKEYVVQDGDVISIRFAV